MYAWLKWLYSVRTYAFKWNGWGFLYPLFFIHHMNKKKLPVIFKPCVLEWIWRIDECISLGESCTNTQWNVLVFPAAMSNLEKIRRCVFNVGGACALGAPAVIWLTKRSPDSQGGDVPLIFPVLLSWCDSVVKNIPDKGCEKATAYRDIHGLTDLTPEGVETNQGKENFLIVKCELLIWENSTILWHHSLLFCEPVQVPKKCHTSCRGSSHFPAIPPRPCQDILCGRVSANLISRIRLMACAPGAGVRSHDLFWIAPFIRL